MQYRINKIYFNETKPDGTAWESKGGKPTKKVSMKLDGIDGYVSFFDQGSYAHLKAGDSISGDIESKGQYKNFKPHRGSESAPSPQGGPVAGLTEVNEKLDRILSILSNNSTKVPQKDDLPF